MDDPADLQLKMAVRDVDRGRAARRWVAGIALALTIVAAAAPASAQRLVAVLFTGFGAIPGGAGLDELEAALLDRFGGDPARPYSSRVFAYTEESAAFAFVDGFPDLDRLVVIGHSFGADASIELVTDLLAPAGIPVDLLIQLDSVGLGDEVLPAGVALGLNYYQVSTSLFEPQGETFVAGSENFQVEVLYGVSDADITHTTIEEPLFEYSETAYAALFGAQPDLFARIEARVAALVAPGVPGLFGVGGGLLLVATLAAALRALRATRVHRPGRASTNSRVRA